MSLDPGDTDHEAVARGWGEPLAEGLRRFNERDHPDRAAGGGTLTVGLRRG